jgi:hypothetical protein
MEYMAKNEEEFAQNHVLKSMRKAVKEMNVYRSRNNK